MKGSVSVVAETFREAYGWQFAAADCIRDAVQAVRHSFPTEASTKAPRDLKLIFDHLRSVDSELSYSEHWQKVITLLQLDCGGRVQNTRGVQRVGDNTRMLTRGGEATREPRLCHSITLRFKKPKTAGGSPWSKWLTFERVRAAHAKMRALQAKQVCFVECFANWVARVGAVAFDDGPAPKGRNKDLDRYGDTPFRSETGFAPIRSHMAVAIKNVLIQSTFMSADEARSHATRAHAESAWQHCDAPQFSEKNIHDRTLHGTKMWASTYFVPRVQRVKEAWDTLSTNLRSTIRWCELLRL